MNLRVFAGAGMEPRKISGISHFVEHMVFEGTEEFPNKYELDEKIEYLGGKYSAYTDYSTVDITISVPDTQFDFGFQYLKQIAFHATFPEESFKSEKEAILDEINTDNNNPYRKFNRFTEKYRYIKGTPPTNIGGTPTTVKRMTRKNLIDWYRYIFSPHNITLAVVGNINLDKTAAKIQNEWGQFKNSGKKVVAEDFESFNHSSFTVKTQINRNSKEAIGSISFPSLINFKNTLKEMETNVILIALIGNLQSSILYRKLRKEMGLIYTVDIESYYGIRNPGINEISFSTSDDKMAKVHKIVQDELDQLLGRGLDPKQLDLGIKCGNSGLLVSYSSVSEILSWFMWIVFWHDKIYSIEDVIKLRSSIDLDFANSMLRKIYDKKMMNVISKVNTSKAKKEIEDLF